MLTREVESDNWVGLSLFRRAAALAAPALLVTSVSVLAAEKSDSLEEVVVTGIRASLNEAVDLKRDADVIQDSIVAEDIGKFPDQNVAESLQRITGVSISRVNGEGSQVSVRSFGPQFNMVKLNSRSLATTTGQRSFDFQVLPSELIGGADVIKSPTADLAAGSIGAYVNIRTPRPLDDPGFNAVAAVNGNYHDLAQDVNPEMSGLLSNTFAGNTVGVLLGVTYKESEGRIDSYRGSIWNEYAPNGTGYGLPMGDQTLGEDGQPTTLEGSRGPGRTRYNMVDERRERAGAVAVFQWAPSDHFVTTVDLFHTRLDRDFLGSGLQVPNQVLSRYTRAVVSDSGTILQSTIANTDVEMNVVYGDEKSTTDAFGLNSLWTRGALTLAFDASYSKAERDFEGDDSTALHYTLFNDAGGIDPGEISLDYSTDIPSMTTTGGLDVTDISKVRAAWQRHAAEEVEDEVSELKLDALYEVDAGILSSVKVGVAYEQRTIGFADFGTEFDAASGGQTWNGAGMWIGDGSTWGTDPNIGVLPSGVLELSDSNFMRGISGNFPRQWVQIRDIKAYRAATQAYLEQLVASDPTQAWRADVVNAGWDTVYPGPGGTYENDEDTLSLYTQFNLRGDIGRVGWAGNVGVRYVSITNTSIGTASTIDLLRLDPQASNLPDHVVNTATTSPKVLEVETDEDHFLPSFNLRLDLGGGHYLRSAAAKTITRPALGDQGVNLQESGGVNAPTVAITGGNPYLESYEVSQFDLSYEFYSQQDSAYSISYFYKDISKFISTINTVGPWDGPIEPALAAAYAANGQVVNFVSTRKENRPGGVVQGVELGALHYFSYLPGFWNGFGVQANYTFADSEDKDAAPINQPGVPEPGSSLEGFAEHSYNVVGFYDKGKFQARLAYNWRDNFMSSRTGDGLQPEYTEDFGQLDLSMSYDVTDNLTAALEAINLTNETRLMYLGQRDRVSLVEMSGVRYQLGLRATF
ncbi:TonB-dependent receptor [Steroidobacter sp. S1-65]|uniref:TonB-dependent receptor n=1 Tax=Steroidobacter gossypii TaxID=2805490 RepID=A0ABS1WVM4_9GAMM|nr:TonB-dependent receptor [Steroidobacter gossypii]MBM0105002.1 TonB-dependent receptor [Steroidobacter gossypii]